MPLPIKQEFEEESSLSSEAFEVVVVASLRFGQRTRIRRLAAAWLRDPCRPRLPARAIRFDAIGVLVDGGEALVHLEHVEGAW